ncbi:uncharacterized protein LOC120446105 isoform X1 [Drosophila santomea]|uniref:uncharacterized protein LOC120446105 isoform X1 n=1 Tax=Drosophila santomea TaxID=129105 RepID=UPI0019549C39|nr:uncharacterized protein LOC120446105 isoform X1 [Drosophila santomea]XP_039482831.1 uncharacterized protein LOC120446105 isoform X1 [Drosophila santomea]
MFKNRRTDPRMECEICDITSNAGGHKLNPADLKPETTLEMEIDEALSSSSADDTPPGMMVVETRISSWPKVQCFECKDATTTDAEDPQLPACSLGLKPNVQFQKLSHPNHPLVSTETALAAASCSAYSRAPAKPSVTDSIATLRHCVDGTTQCNNLNYESASNESMPSVGSLVCRICHNADNPEQLVSPCLCKGSMTYVHVHCLECWISTSRCTTCELCQFQYNTEQTLRFRCRYTCLQSLRLWYTRAMSRRALQEDCQMFSLLTLVAFGIIGTLLVGIQYYALHTHSWGLSKLWTKSWMLFFLFMTITVYFANIYMLIKSQLTPWYRWWQSARDIKLILENRRPFPNPSRFLRPFHMETASTTASMFTHHDQQEVPVTSSSPALVITSSDEEAEAKLAPKWGMRLDSDVLAAVVAATVESIADASARESEKQDEEQQQNPLQQQQQQRQPDGGN